MRARASTDRTGLDGVLAHFDGARGGGENGDRPALIRHGGAGMGLAIARGLVEAQGGRIWVENLPDGGARFAFTLPIAEREPAIA